MLNFWGVQYFIFQSLQDDSRERFTLTVHVPFCALEDGAAILRADRDFLRGRKSSHDQ